MITERSVPTDALANMNLQETEDLYLIFLEITHPGLSEVIRVVSDSEDAYLEGVLYTGFPFEIELLSDSESMPGAQLSVQNVDRRLGDALLKVTDPARLAIRILSLNEFNTETQLKMSIDPPSYVYRAEALYLINVQVTAMVVTGRIVSWDYSQEPYPGIYATQNRFPGLFR